MITKINILYIFHVSTFGGGSFCLLNMIKKLDRDFFNPIVLLKNNGPLCIELEKLGATVVLEKTISTVPYNRAILKFDSLKQIISVLYSLKKVKYWIKKTNADIVHINTMMMYPYAIPARNLGKKVIIHIREHWPENENKFQLKIAKKIIEQYSDKIIAINKTSATIIGLPHKTEVIYDWIDFGERDEPLDFEYLIGSDFKLTKPFLFLGGMQIIKGALEVVTIFTEQIHEKNARLIFVGCKDKKFDYKGTKGKIKALLRLIGFPVFSDKIKLLAEKDKRIIFLPATNQVKTLIEQSYCVVSFFTIPHANLPLAEAAWLGKPSIAVNTPEAKEYSDDGKAALLFTMKDKVDFKNKILFALENEALINGNAINGISNIREKFDPSRNSNLLNMIYKELVSQNLNYHV